MRWFTYIVDCRYETPGFVTHTLMFSKLKILHKSAGEKQQENLSNAYVIELYNGGLQSPQYST